MPVADGTVDEAEQVKRVRACARATHATWLSLSGILLGVLVASRVLNRMLILRKGQREIAAFMKVVIYSGTVGLTLLVYLMTRFGGQALFEIREAHRLRKAIESARVYFSLGVEPHWVMKELNSESHTWNGLIAAALVAFATVVAGHLQVRVKA